jgi:hypothetical protein
MGDHVEGDIELLELLQLAEIDRQEGHFIELSQ